MKILITEKQLQLIKQPLLEDVKLSVKLLNDNNIPLDDPNYLEAKEFLLKKNSIGYLGPVVKLAINSRMKFINVAQYVMDNKEFISALKTPILSYENIDGLDDSIEKIKTNRKVKKLTNKLTNKYLIGLLLGQEDFTSGEINNIEFFLEIPSPSQKEFLSKSDKYDNLKQFYNDLEEFIQNYSEGFTYDRVSSLIERMDNDEIKLLYNKNNLILAWIRKYSASSKIGSKSWCIVGDEYQFNNYTENGKNKQYFLFNFNDDVKSNEKMIAFTLKDNNEVRASHDRYDVGFSEIKNYLTSIGILEKVYLINSRLRAEDASNFGLGMDEYGAPRLWLNKKFKFGSDEFYYVKSYEYDDNLKQLVSEIKDILSSKLFKYNDNIDLLVDKYQYYPVYNNNNEGGGWKKHSSINLIRTLTDEDNWSDGEKGTMIKFFKKLYMSSLKLNDDSKFAITHLLKDNGIDIVKLSKLKKDKSNQDLSGYEFNDLTRRGVDLKPIIQNKLSAIRRGEDVNLTSTEVNFAIDNGYRNIIEKYYKNMVPSFGTNQLSYEDLQIYNKLGMLPEIEKVIKSKVNNYGVETLNSIEKSVYDMSLRR